MRTTSSSTSARVSFGGLDALREALAVAWWYKPDLERFVRACVPHAEIVAQLNFGETKREVAAELVGLLGADARYTPTVLDLMRELCSLDDSFPHLARLEDGKLKVVAARARFAHSVSTTRFIRG